MSFNDEVAIILVKGSKFRIQFLNMRKDEAIQRMKNANFTEKVDQN